MRKELLEQNICGQWRMCSYVCAVCAKGTINILPVVDIDLNNLSLEKEIISNQIDKLTASPS